MNKRDLPKMTAFAKPGALTEIIPVALSRWNEEIRAAGEEETENTISMLGPIGSDFWGEGVSAKRIAAALRSIGERDVVVHINSPGGDFFEGLAIYNMLREHNGSVTVKVLGMAASAASIIALAADDVRIARAGTFMIHNTNVCACGDRNAHREVADWMEPFDQMLVDIYAARTGMDERDLRNMLDRETWIGGSEAVEKGFADGLLESDEVETETRDAAEASAKAAVRKIDALLAQSGVTRSERRNLIRASKGDMPGAVTTGMQDAAVITEVSSLLDDLKKI